MFVLQPLVGRLADHLVSSSSGWWTMTRTRKVGNSFGMMSYAIFFGTLGIPVVQERVGLGVAVALFSAGIALGGAAPACGYWATYADLSPRYAGVLIGIGNTFATIRTFTPLSITRTHGMQQTNALLRYDVSTTAGILGNLISGTIVGDRCDDDDDSCENRNDGLKWSLVFGISSILSVLGTAVFVRYGSSTRAAFDAMQATVDDNGGICDMRGEVITQQKRGLREGLLDHEGAYTNP